MACIGGTKSLYQTVHGYLNIKWNMDQPLENNTAKKSTANQPTHVTQN